LSGIP